MPANDRVKLAQRHEKLRELMSGKVLQFVGRRVSEGEKDFIAQEVDMLIHRGDSSEKQLKAIAAHVRSLSNAPSQASAAPTEDRLRTHNKQQPPARHPQAPSDVAAGRRAPSNVPTSVVSAARQADAAVKDIKLTSSSSAAGPAGKRGAPNGLPPGVTPDMLAALDSEHHGSTKRIPRPADLHKDDLWAKLAQKEAEEYHRQALEERRKHKKQEAEQRQYLEQQVALRNRKAQEVKVDAEKYIVEETKQRDQWEEAERRKEAERKRRFAEEKRNRDAQLEAARERRAMDETRRKLEEAETARKIQEDNDREQQQQQLRRVKAKEEVVKAQEFNRHFEEVRQKDKSKEKERDLEHQRQYLERLKRIDDEREATLVKMHEKQRHQQKIASAMQSDLLEKAKDDERKAAEHKQRKEAEELAREKAVADKAAAAKVKQRQYLMLQMLEREEARKRERDDVAVQRERLLQEQAEAERKEAEKKALTKKRAEEHRRAVESQIHDSAVRSRPVYMTDAEKRLNVPLLKKAGLSPVPE